MSNVSNSKKGAVSRCFHCLVGLVAMPIICVWIWIVFPKNIMERWSKNLKAGDFDAHFLYYAALALCGLGLWKMWELIL